MTSKNYRLRVLSVSLAMLLGAFSLVGCDSVNNSTSGRVQVFLSDAAPAVAKTSDGSSSFTTPDDFPAEIDSAVVVIDRIELVGDTSQPAGLVLMDDEVLVNLLEFEQGVDTLLADELVPEGDYTQLRFYVTDATVYLNGDEDGELLTVPSGFVRINLPEFEIDEEDDLVVIELDFDVTQSFVKAGSSGKYLFKPVIHPIAFTINGEDVDLPAEGESTAVE